MFIFLFSMALHIKGKIRFPRCFDCLSPSFQRISYTNVILSNPQPSENLFLPSTSISVTDNTIHPTVEAQNPQILVSFLSLTPNISKSWWICIQRYHPKPTTPVHPSLSHPLPTPFFLPQSVSNLLTLFPTLFLSPTSYTKMNPECLKYHFSPY